MNCGGEIEWDEPRLLRLVQACDTAAKRLRDNPPESERDLLLERVEAARAGAFEELSVLHLSAEQRPGVQANVGRADWLSDTSDPERPNPSDIYAEEQPGEAVAGDHFLSRSCRPPLPRRHHPTAAIRRHCPKGRDRTWLMWGLLSAGDRRPSVKEEGPIVDESLLGAPDQRRVAPRGRPRARPPPRQHRSAGSARRRRRCRRRTRPSPGRVPRWCP